MTASVLGIAVLAAAWYGYAYAVSPAGIRHPAQTHYHFRLQVINDGKPVSFADSKFQTEFNKDNCSAALTKEPVHFHDGLDQFVHIHWANLTGGIVLKQYGWNFIGGTDGTIGYKFDGLKLPQRVKIHGKELPRPPAGAKYYVYTGTENDFRERNWKDFLNQDLPKFLSGDPVTSFADWLVPTASAHNDGTVHAEPAAHSEQEHLAQLNKVIGNVVIFVQKDKPSDQQVKDRLHQLIPLPESACAG